MLPKYKNWVIWKDEIRAGKSTKIPYSSTGLLASSTDPKTWSTFEEAQVAKKTHNASGIGFVLPLDNSMVAIDLDKCLVEGKTINNPQFAELVEKSNTYTEISPSGKGLHLFFHVSDTINLEAHRSKKCPGFECYSSGRYLTYTGKVFGKEQEIRKLTSKELIILLSVVGYPWKEEVKKTSSSTISVSLGDNEILSRMFGSKNGKKIEALYNGDLTEYNNDDSSADMALCMHLAFWTQKDTERMRTLWLSSPLGQREKTQKRKDYQDTTISHAITATGETYSPRDKKNIVASFDLMTNNKGNPFENAENILRILRNDELLSTSFRYNAFTHEEETNLGGRYNDKEWRTIDRAEISFVTLHIQRNYPFFERISKQPIEDALFVFSREHTINPVYDWITSLEWDGKHRLNHWLSHTFGVEDDAYHSAVGANWFKGLVRRIIMPGCKFDYLLILEGPQGWKKSTTLYTIGKGYHVETILTPENKDFFMLMKSNFIVEFSEGHTMNRADTRLLKSVITTQEDQYRVPFGRSIHKYPRHCVFAMTTNENQYLRDETGNRRFLPVVIEKPADIEWLEANLDQLYAEAYHRAIIEKESYWEFPEEETKLMQQSKMIENPYTESLISWYSSLSPSVRAEGITALQAYQAVWQQNAPLGREMSVVNTMQVTSLFATVLRLKKRRITSKEGKTQTQTRWFQTNETPSQGVILDPAELEFQNI